MKHHLKSEHGQALILLVLGLVGLLGFAGLAIDGSIIYSDRRYAQNAADTAAMAGALAKINADSNWADVALNAATENGFNNDGATNVVQVHSPPVSGPYTGQANYVQAIISDKVDTVFAHFVYQGLVENTVEAVVEWKPPVTGPLYGGNALVGLNPDACDTVRVGGNADTEITGGGVFVNSDHPDCAFRLHGSGNLYVDGGVDVVGGWKYNGPGQVLPNDPVSGATQVAYPPDPDVPTPDCDSMGEATPDPADPTRLFPGNYSGANFPPTGITRFGDPSDIDGATGLLNPQIFCIDVTNRFHLSSNTYEGDGVLFYMINGDVVWNADADIHFTPPETGDYKGMLLFVDPKDYENPPNSSVTLNGQSSSSIVGTIWAPASHCKLNGTGGEDSYQLQVVCYNIELLGSNTLNIDYNPGDAFELNHPGKITLSQ